MTRSNASVITSTRLVGSDDRPRFGVVVQLDKRHGGKQSAEAASLNIKTMEKR